MAVVCYVRINGIVMSILYILRICSCSLICFFVQFRVTLQITFIINDIDLCLKLLFQINH